MVLSGLAGPGMEEAVGKEGRVNQHTGEKSVPDTLGIPGMSTHGGCKPTRDTWPDTGHPGIRQAKESPWDKCVGFGNQGESNPA